MKKARWSDEMLQKYWTIRPNLFFFLDGFNEQFEFTFKDPRFCEHPRNLKHSSLILQVNFIDLFFWSHSIRSRRAAEHLMFYCSS